jgi:V/A-type H+/Na+-transporting ATPase subunit E
MKGLDTGKDKVRKICEALKTEALDPAKRDSEELIAQAKELKEKMLKEARADIERMHADAHLEIQRQKNVFQSSLNQACRQALESLKQAIEEKLFNKELGHLIKGSLQEPAVLSKLITAIVKAIEEEGPGADLSALVPAAVPAREVNRLLAKEIIERLKEKSVLVGPFGGGVEVKLVNNHLTLDLSDEAIKELVANYIRKDFREMLFG